MPAPTGIAAVINSYSRGHSSQVGQTLIAQQIIVGQVKKRRKYKTQIWTPKKIVITTKPLTQNATVKASTSNLLLQNSRLKDAITRLLQQNAFLDSIQTLLQNARVKTTSEVTLPQNATVIFTSTQTLGSNATIKTATSQLLLQNARIILPAVIQTLTQNSYIKAVISQTLVGNSTIKDIVSKILSQDARIKLTQTPTLSQDARVKLTVTTALGQNASIKVIDIVKLLSQNSSLKALGVTQSLTQNARLNLLGITQILSQNAHVKFNPSAGPVNILIDIDSVISPIVGQTEFPVILKLTANNGDPLVNKVVFLQRSLDNGATWKTIRSARTNSIGEAIIRHIETLSTDVFEPKIILYRGHFNGDSIALTNNSTPVLVSVQSGNLRNPTPIPLTSPKQMITLMKGEDFYALLPDGRWLKLPKIIAENFGKFTVESNT